MENLKIAGPFSTIKMFLKIKVRDKGIIDKTTGIIPII